MRRPLCRPLRFQLSAFRISAFPSTARDFTSAIKYSLSNKTKFMKTTHFRRTFLNVSLAGILALSLLTGCTTQNAATSHARSKLGTIPEFHPELGLGALQGYLATSNLPNSFLLI